MEDSIFRRRHQGKPSLALNTLKFPVTIRVFWFLSEEQRRAAHQANKLRKIQENVASEIHLNDTSTGEPQYPPKRVRESEALAKPPVGIPILPVKGVDARLRAQTNNQLVNDRAAIRMANDPNRMAAQLLRGELRGGQSVTSEVPQVIGHKRKADEMEADEIKEEKPAVQETENEGPTDSVRWQE